MARISPSVAADGSTVKMNEKRRGNKILNDISLVLSDPSIVQGNLSPNVVKRISMITLILAGTEVEKIVELTGVCKTTVYDWKKRIKNINSLNDIKRIFSYRISGNGIRDRKLDKISTELQEELDHNNYSTLQQIITSIKEKFNIEVSASCVHTFLEENNYRKLKCGSLPAKADPVVQRIFYDTILLPLIKEAEEGNIKLYFVDAAHFVIGSDFISSVYSKERRFATTLSGRQRYNVLGALDYNSKEVVTITNSTESKDKYITAIQVKELLHELHDISVKSGGKPVKLVLDNARYQKCKAVIECAEQLGVELVFLPPYSPNLNFIERFWKFTKSKLRTKYYTDFSEFCNKIDSIIASSTGENKEEIEKLIGKKVQLFDDLIPIGEKSNTYIKAESQKAS